MAFMRLGTRVAVINDAGEILLSKRSDLGVWAIPGGRLDSGERIQDCAIREVREETGLEIEIERAVGLYYQQGRNRTDILYRAKPIGGALFSQSDETLANRFFAPDNLPQIPFGQFYIDHAYTDKTYLYTIKTPRPELIKLDLQLRWRWIQNLLSGRPEPKFPHFDIRAVGIVFNPAYDRLIIFGDQLFRVSCMGEIPLHYHLLDVYPLQSSWKWAGLFQDTQTDTIEFVFEAVEAAVMTKWKTVTDLLNLRDRQYVELTAKHRDGVWLLAESLDNKST